MVNQKLFLKCLFIFVACLAVPSCKMFEPIGENLGNGLARGFESRADSLGGKLTSGVLTSARDTLANEETRRKLKEIVDSLAGELLRQVAATRDTLMGDYTRAYVLALRDDLLGKGTKDKLAAMRDELMGTKTQRALAALRNELLGDSARAQAAAFGAALLGRGTRAAIDTLVAEVIATAATSLKDKIQPLAREEESWIKKYAAEILWIAGGITAILLGLLGLIFVRKKRELNLVKVMTREIANMPDPAVREDLKKRISDKAVKEGVEPHLREVLREQKILDER